MLNSIKSMFGKSASGSEVAEKLGVLGYFRLADPQEVAALKEEMASSYDAYGMLSTLYARMENGKYYPKDYRLYSLDGGRLFEKGGYVYYLDKISITLRKLGVAFVIEDDVEAYDEHTGFTHSIQINGRKYAIFKNFTDYGRGAQVATVQFIRMVNDVLARQSLNERLYPISGGSDGQMIFLGPAQYRYISKVLPEGQRKPQPVRQWARNQGL